MKKHLISLICILSLSSCGVTTAVSKVEHDLVDEYCASNDELTRLSIRNSLAYRPISPKGNRLDVKIHCASDELRPQ